MRRSELLSGVILLLISGFYIWGAGLLPFGKLSAPGSGFLPFFEGILLAVGAVALLIGSLRRERISQVGWPKGDARKMVLRLWAALAGYAFLIPWFGYVVPTALFVFTVSRAWRQQSSPVLALWGAGLSLAMYGLFVVLLKIPLPSGPFGLP